MRQQLILTVGLPGSGKSTWFGENFKYEPSKDSYHYQEKDGYVLVSADIERQRLSGYDPNNPELVHEEAIEIAENLVYDYLRNKKNVYMDGGGINNRYTPRIITTAREINPEVFVKVIYFNTPIEVCIERISKRERKVPIDNIYKKNQMLPRCLNRLKEMCDEFEEVRYFTDKYLFLDMDGTVCSFSNVNRDIDNNLDFVNGEVFKHLRPVYHIIEKVRNLYKPENVFILTACPNNIAWEEKKWWLKQYMPFLLDENIYFVGNKDYKHVFLNHLLLKKKFKKQDVCVVDDNYQIIEKMRDIGVNILHPSDIEVLNYNQKL
jgi:predicted kinase